MFIMFMDFQQNLFKPEDFKRNLNKDGKRMGERNANTWRVKIIDN